MSENNSDAASFAQVEAQVRRAVYAYCRALDRHDSALLESVFWPDAVIQTSTIRGTRDDFVRGITEVFSRIGLTQHLVGNVLVELDGATAWVESYMHAFHRLSAEGGPDFDFFVGGRYQDRFEVRGGVWKVAERRMVFDWFRECADSGDWAQGNAMGMGSPGMTIGTPGFGPWLEFERSFTPNS